MDLYLVPHGQMVMQAVETSGRSGIAAAPVTIGEAVGSDITNVVSNALATGQSGAAALVMQNYLDHDQPVAVSKFTRELIVASGAKVDEALGTNFAQQLSERVRISYPAIDTSAYLSPTISVAEQAAILSKRGLVRDGYVLFLSRLTKAKGVDDLIHAYRASNLYRRMPLVVCGSGPDEEFFHTIANRDPSILFFNDIGDLEKLAFMSGCHAYTLPSKPRVEFTETFGIAIAEAMLSGGIGPVITTRTGGIPEATGDHCLYHKAGDVADLVACLNKVASMPDHYRAYLSQQARSYACRFDRERILKSLLTQSTVQTAA
jgi:glycosyltransferase involved in cell wall biosynthesis